MLDVFKPSRPDELIDVIRWAAANGTPLAVEGGRSKAGIGCPIHAASVLSLAGFAGVSQYEPNELVLTAGAGTPLAEIEALLAAHHQILAFEPPDYSSLLGMKAQPRQGTLGGILAGNISGPRRFLAGAARDHFLGFRAVNGRGEPFKSGGRVVKNVTGFDLPKLLAGSWGTLAALWEVTVKVLPMPEKTRTLLVFGLDDAKANNLIGRAVASAYAVTGAAHLPARVAARSAVARVAQFAATQTGALAGSAATAVTALRVEGPDPSVRHRIDGLKALLVGTSHPCDELHSANSLQLWREIGDLALLQGGAAREIWRLSLPPAAAANVARRLVDDGRAREHSAVGDAESAMEWLHDQAGGTLWLSCPAGVAAQRIRGALAPEGGHATLWHASAQRRAEVPVFQPQPHALAALTRRIKNSFDPQSVLNPGRMYAGV